jgi:hypothetical protein
MRKAHPPAASRAMRGDSIRCAEHRPGLMEILRA